MTAANRYAMAGRLGALAKWSNTTNRSAATEAARRAADDRWVREVRDEHPDLDDKSVEQMADARRRMYFARLSQRGVAARQAKRGTGTSGRRAA